MKDKLFDERKLTISFDNVRVSDANDARLIASVRYNEVMIDTIDGMRLPAWKWQRWVDVRGEVHVRTLDGTVEGFIWPMTSSKDGAK